MEALRAGLPGTEVEWEDFSSLHCAMAMVEKLTHERGRSDLGMKVARGIHAGKRRSVKHSGDYTLHSGQA